MKRAFVRVMVAAVSATTMSVTSVAQADGALDSPSPPKGAYDGRDRDRYGWWVPDFARLQTGGFQGHLNVGVGYSVFDDILNWKLGYGYVASGVDVDEPIHMLDTSISLRPFEVGRESARWVPVYLGAGLIYVFGSQYHVMVPKRYAHLSETYYRPTAVHWTSHIGTEVAWRPDDGGFVERHALFYQAILMDQLGLAYLENRETVKLTDAFASAVGYRMAW